MSAKYIIAETETFSKHIAIPDYEQLSKKLNNFIYPQLTENPHFGTNIKKLKGEFEGLYRYRAGSVRVFYTIDEKSKHIFMLEIQKRKNAYKKK
ncbi:MAG: type II toxin-antitoxin system RelE/ParE family toxin [Ignavibacteriae bacterium]|nr:type II toxin-antitoxin system RelE/ParE family toxin [Ignavibacteriota bacterium]